MRGPTVQPTERVWRRGAKTAGISILARGSSAAGEGSGPVRARTRGDLVPGFVFCATVASYLASILPRVTRELAHWRCAARRIPDPALRKLALDALSKRGNMEGAALFAVLAPRACRRETVRALVAFQTAYNYLDALAERPSADPLRNGRRLHEALLVALDPSAAHVDYYLHHPQREDGGYLAELVDTCRSAFLTLPSHDAVSGAAWAAAARIVVFQSLNLTHEQGGHDALERWARYQTPAGSGLDWWQTAAAGGSSLAVYALIAAAGKADVQPSDAAGIEGAYFPWICALHSLLDSLVDVEEDERAGQRNLLSYHASQQQAAFAMKMLAQRAMAAARGLPEAPRHGVILTAMATYYLSSPEASRPDARATVGKLTATLGPLVGPALLLFKARRLAARLTYGAYR
jgi:tetraprenyl-beta-curcumene synthase